jgi:hypothetical protein
VTAASGISTVLFSSRPVVLYIMIAVTLLTRTRGLLGFAAL